MRSREIAESEAARAWQNGRFGMPDDVVTRPQPHYGVISPSTFAEQNMGWIMSSGSPDGRTPRREAWDSSNSKA